MLNIARYDGARGPFAAVAEMMRSPLDLVVAAGPEIALQAVVGASGFIPIVILAVQYDPIERGYVTSLSRPGGNITGVFYRQIELAQKQLELLAQAFPERTRLAVLWDVASTDQFNAAELTAKSLPLELRLSKLERPPYDFDAAFQTMAQDDRHKWSGPVPLPSSACSVRVVRGARDPTSLANDVCLKPYVEAGGLMSYGGRSRSDAIAAPPTTSPRFSRAQSRPISR